MGGHNRYICVWVVQTRNERSFANKGAIGMRILIHSDEYYPTCAACAYRMKVFADTFAQLGHDVTVIASSTNKENGVMQSCRERIIFSPAIKMKKKTTVMRMLNNLSFAFTSVFTALKAGKADVVITTSPPPLVSISGWLIAKMKGAKLVYDVRDIWPDVALEMNSFSENSLFCKVFRWITNFMYRHSDLVTTVSPGKVEKIRGKLPETMREKVHLVGNGFDESILEQAVDLDVLSKYSLNDKFTCVYIGNVGLAQGLDVLLDVASQTKHHDVQFLIFGTGAERDILEQRVEKENIKNVKFCGVIPHEKVLTVLQAAQISFIPLKSSKMKDSIPTKVYEALGIGCPVLLVADGDACDIVEECGLGCCVSPDTPHILTHVFDEMVDHYDSFVQKKESAIHLIKHKYSRQAIAKAFEEDLKRIV